MLSVFLGDNRRIKGFDNLSKGLLISSESDMYSATINEDYYAEAGVVSKGVSASCN